MVGNYYFSCLDEGRKKFVHGFVLGKGLHRRPVAHAPVLTNSEATDLNILQNIASTL